jgi:hypothetical protein
MMENGVSPVKGPEVRRSRFFSQDGIRVVGSVRALAAEDPRDREGELDDAAILAVRPSSHASEDYETYGRKDHEGDHGHGDEGGADAQRGTSKNGNEVDDAEHDRYAPEQARQWITIFSRRPEEGRGEPREPPQSIVVKSAPSQNAGGVVEE